MLLVCAEGTSLTDSILPLDTETLEDMRDLVDGKNLMTLACGKLHIMLTALQLRQT